MKHFVKENAQMKHFGKENAQMKHFVKQTHIEMSKMIQ